MVNVVNRPVKLSSHHESTWSHKTLQQKVLISKPHDMYVPLNHKSGIRGYGSIWLVLLAHKVSNQHAILRPITAGFHFFEWCGVLAVKYPVLNACMWLDMHTSVHVNATLYRQKVSSQHSAVAKNLQDQPREDFIPWNNSVFANEIRCI